MNCYVQNNSIYFFVILAGGERRDTCLFVYFGHSLAAEFNFLIDIAYLSKCKCHPIHLKQNVKKWKKYVTAHRHLLIEDTQRCEKTIGTHNGTFHCDEALAVFLLRQTNTFRDAGKAILYSRNSYSYFH